MSNYILVTIDPRFTAETIARTGSEQLMDKVTRGFVGLYDQQENWYIPLRANIGRKKPDGAYYETPFKTNNPHFKRPGLDFEKAVFVPKEYVLEIKNTLPNEQSEFIQVHQESIREAFEKYVFSLENVPKKSPSYMFSTVPLFPDGIRKLKQFTSNKQPERGMTATEKIEFYKEKDLKAEAPTFVEPKLGERKAR